MSAEEAVMTEEEKAQKTIQAANAAKLSAFQVDFQALQDRHKISVVPCVQITGNQIESMLSLQIRN